MGQLSQEEKIKALRQCMADLKSQEVLRWGANIHSAGAKLFAKLPDGLEIDLPIPGIQDANLERIDHEQE